MLVWCRRTFLPAASAVALMLITPPTAAQQRDPSARGTPADSVATVNGVHITAAEIEARVGAQVRQLEERIYAVRRQALEQLIVDEVIRQEATRRDLATEDLRKQVTADVTVDDAAVTQHLEANAQQFRSMEPDLAREAARVAALNRAKIAKYGELVRDLRTRAAINITLAEPAPIMVDIDPMRGFALGPKDAPVSIVEFSDYQCPYCARLNPVLDEILTEYAGKVRLVMRDFPLSNHAQASSAAAAARCAGEQGKYWEYHRALFQTAAAIDAQTLDTLASRFKLDLARFQTCKASEQTAAAIKADLAEGEKIGVRGTPTMVVNGKLVRGARSKQDLQRIIDAALREPVTAGGGQP